jgi:hypothetical protein
MKNGDVFHSYVIYIYYQRVCLKSGTTKSKVKFNGFLMFFEGYTKKKKIWSGSDPNGQLLVQLLMPLLQSLHGGLTVPGQPK